MPRYWWVNHKQTVRQEIGGGYLWSPKRENSGARSQFYENMRLAKPGDVVLSFAATWIRYVGVVEALCVTAPKPGHFGATGAYWAQDGWWLPVRWIPLLNPVRPRDFIDHLAPLLPRKHSPFNAAKGAGNQKAYLAQVERTVVEMVLRRVPESLFGTGGTHRRRDGPPPRSRKPIWHRWNAPS